MKNKQIYVYILLFIIILFSFMIPKLISNINEKNIFEKTYIANRKIQTLSKKSSDIQLINIIYSRYNNSQKYNVQVSDVNESTSEILKMENEKISISKNSELAKITELINQDIINKKFLEDLLETESIIYRKWEYNNEEITYSKIKIFTNQDSYKNAIANIEIEKTTNKIISLAFKNEYISTDENNLKKYIKYLELDIIKDWESINQELKSETAKLKISIIKDNEITHLKLTPIN